MMMKAGPLIILVASLTAACAGPGPGVAGNETGGIIPWSPENERAAFPVADAYCGQYGKLAKIASVYRQPGHYIAFACLFPRGDIVRDRATALRSRG